MVPDIAGCFGALILRCRAAASKDGGDVAAFSFEETPSPRLAIRAFFVQFAPLERLALWAGAKPRACPAPAQDAVWLWRLSWRAMRP